ncbi:addiction module toxin RelE [Candidatus Campbellbacteria bacterium]|nr:MAG: addiction module toxin RelE [Candidatus Campbellbacteria bacterium]
MERQIIKYKKYFDKFYEKLEHDEKIEIREGLYLLAYGKELEKKNLIKRMKNGDGIYELRLKTEKSIFRVFYFYDGQKIVVLFQGMKKKDKKRQQKELQKAIKLKKEYLSDK